MCTKKMPGNCSLFMPSWGPAANPCVGPPFTVGWDLWEPPDAFCLGLGPAPVLGAGSSPLASFGLSGGFPKARDLCEGGSSQVLVRWLPLHGVLQELSPVREIRNKPWGRKDSRDCHRAERASTYSVHHCFCSLARRPTTAVRGKGRSFELTG